MSLQMEDKCGNIFDSLTELLTDYDEDNAQPSTKHESKGEISSNKSESPKSNNIELDLNGVVGESSINPTEAPKQDEVSKEQETETKPTVTSVYGELETLKSNFIDIRIENPNVHFKSKSFQCSDRFQEMSRLSPVHRSYLAAKSHELRYPASLACRMCENQRTVALSGLLQPFREKEGEVGCGSTRNAQRSFLDIDQSHFPWPRENGHGKAPPRQNPEPPVIVDLEKNKKPPPAKKSRRVDDSKLLVVSFREKNFELSPNLAGECETAPLSSITSAHNMPTLSQDATLLAISSRQQHFHNTDISWPMPVVADDNPRVRGLLSGDLVRLACLIGEEFWALLVGELRKRTDRVPVTRLLFKDPFRKQTYPVNQSIFLRACGAKIAELSVCWLDNELDQLVSEASAFLRNNLHHNFGLKVPFARLFPLVAVYAERVARASKPRMTPKPALTFVPPVLAAQFASNAKGVNAACQLFSLAFAKLFLSEDVEMMDFDQFVRFVTQRFSGQRVSDRNLFTRFSKCHEQLVPCFRSLRDSYASMVAASASLASRYRLEKAPNSLRANRSASDVEMDQKRAKLFDSWDVARDNIVRIIKTEYYPHLFVLIEATNSLQSYLTMLLEPSTYFGIFRTPSSLSAYTATFCPCGSPYAQMCSDLAVIEANINSSDLQLAYRTCKTLSDFFDPANFLKCLSTVQTQLSQIAKDLHHTRVALSNDWFNAFVHSASPEITYGACDKIGNMVKELQEMLDQIELWLRSVSIHVLFHYAVQMLQGMSLYSADFKNLSFPAPPSMDVPYGCKNDNQIPRQVRYKSRQISLPYESDSRKRPADEPSVASSTSAKRVIQLHP